LKGDVVWHNLSITDARTTTNETTNFSYAGNAEREKDGTNWWRYTDAPKTTTNETTNFSYAGNVDREKEGSNWWRYADAPKTTTNETTNYSYAGNAEREKDGSNWWRYSDAPKTTTNETTNYSYAGNAQREADGVMNRVQFTGETIEIENNKENFSNSSKKIKVKLATSGVTNWGQGEYTLIEDYVPGSNGVMNLQQDAEELIGFTMMPSDWDAINTTGPSTYDQGVPTATHLQQISPDLIGEVKFPANLEMAPDSRQTAVYQIENLKKNGLSIYQDLDLRNVNNGNNVNKYGSNGNNPIPLCINHLIN
jgi:hypothetical protein